MKEEAYKTKSNKSNYGLGNIRQKKDGTFEGRIYDKRIGKQVSVYGKTETEVKKKIRNKQKEILTKDTINTNAKVEEYFIHWLQNYKFHQVKRTTYDKHEQMLNTHIIPRIGYLKMKEITSDDIQKMFNDLSKVRSYSTLKKVMEVVRPCFYHAYNNGDIDKNPMLNVKMPKEENVIIQTKQIQIYSIEELKIIENNYMDLFYNHPKHLYRLSPLYLFLANTGLRRGELLASTWKDVDFENKTITINKSLTRYRNRDTQLAYSGGYQQTILSPKTTTSTRIVDLNQKAISYLLEMKKRNEMFNIHSDLIVCNMQGTVMGNRTFDQELQRMCKRLKIPFKGLHALRHSFATHCIEVGVPVKVVSELLGHKDINITLNTYTHVLKHQKQSAVELLNAI